MSKLQQKWDAILESEGLGVINVGGMPSGINTAKSIKGKHRRATAMANGFSADTAKAAFSYVTARGSDTRRTFAEDVNLLASYDSSCTPLEALSYLLPATQKESELAARERQSLHGLDNQGRPLGKVKRKAGESKAQYAERVKARIMNNVVTDSDPVAYAIPKYDFFKKEQGLPCAVRDGGHGPLSIKDDIKPAKHSAPVEDDVRMSPVVDTAGYLPGRSPFQMSRWVSHNSDITG